LFVQGEAGGGGLLLALGVFAEDIDFDVEGAAGD
jgi:hypothetical protein